MRTSHKNWSPPPKWSPGIHNVQGCPRFARIAGRGTFILWHAYNEEKGQRNRARLQIPTHYTKWLRAIMRLEVQRLKQGNRNSERFQVSRTELYGEGKCSWRVWEAICLEKWLSRDGDHDHHHHHHHRRVASLRSKQKPPPE